MQYKNSYFTLDIDESQVYMNFYPAVSDGEKLKIAEVSGYLDRAGIKDYDLKVINDLIVNSDQPSRLKISSKGAAQIDERMELKVTSDAMYAIVRFFPPSNRGKRITESEIRKDLEYHKVKYGITEDKIQEHMTEPEYFRNIILAMGTAPVQGHDGKINYRFNTDKKARPKLNEDGTVDFHKLNNISHVRKGDVLAVITPADKGTPGCNVFGVELRPDKVVKVNFNKGNNLAVSEDGLQLISMVDGYATLEGDKIFVSDVYDVPADVDNSTGDIEFNGSVVVHGNVRTGFCIKCGGNIEVYGVVEGADLDAGGDIILHRGVQGMRRCQIHAVGNLVSKFIESATVSVDGYINADSILNSQISAHGDIVVSGKGGSIIGGNVRSTTLIEASNIGTPMGVATSVEVGVDPTVQDRIKEIDAMIKDKTAEIEKLSQLVTVFRKKQEMGTLTPDKLPMIAQFTKTIILDKTDIKELMIEREAKEELAGENVDAKIRVVKDIHQGTKITISGDIMILNDKYTHCQYSKRDGEIVSSVW